MFLGNVRANGYQQITDLSTAVPLTVPAGTTLALLKVSGAPVRYRDDGVLPTASVGYPLAVGDELVYTANFSTFRAIQISAGAVLDVIYYAGM